MDPYTKSILAVLAMAVLLNASNPWSQPIAKWLASRSSVDRAESELGSVASSIIAVAALINTINPWGKSIVELAKLNDRTEMHPNQPET
jgi:uncharacterized membrane protein